MINSPTENVKLTFEQLQQLDVLDKRLVVLNSDIATAQKTLKVLKLDTEQAIKEKNHYEGLVNDLKSQNEQAKNQLIDALFQTEETKKVKEINSAEAKTISETHQKKSAELIIREKELVQAEEIFKQKVEDFTIKNSELLKDQLSIKTAKEAFLKATETVKWK